MHEFKKILLIILEISKSASVRNCANKMLSYTCMFTAYQFTLQMKRLSNLSNYNQVLNDRTSVERGTMGTCIHDAHPHPLSQPQASSLTLIVCSKVLIIQLITYPANVCKTVQ
ncbi:unnamed protein product [Orchesella dallaii]|uniref:Secreted protein n=1 Tax=Orchesella dallaii TaxID=48710 RepID=A0ABP1QFP6_9HEXA